MKNVDNTSHFSDWGCGVQWRYRRV